MRLFSHPYNRQLRIIVALVCVVPMTALAMQSTSYQINDDSINTGGTYSASASFRAQDSLGQTQSGAASSTSYMMNAGYQQNDKITISITAPSPITLDPLSLTQQSAVGSTTMTVITNDVNGYTLTLNATSTPAMKSSTNSFADYATSSRTAWSVSNAYQFGFSSYGTNTTGWGTGSSCTQSLDVPSTTLLWSGFNGATTYQVASSTAATTQSGTVTTMCIADAQNGVFAPSGTYSATVVATATAS